MIDAVDNEMKCVKDLISVIHISVSIKKSFSETCSRFESQMGHFNYDAFVKIISDGESEMAIRNYIKGIEGPLGLMIFSTIDHGGLLGVVGKTACAKQYVVGNPLFALLMTEKDIRAGLYAPLRVFIREDGTDKSVIEYDLPSTLFGQFHDAEVTQVGVMLDKKLEDAIHYVSI